MKQNRKITAIITAAGSGTRFSSSGKPKQFIKLNGKPVILYSMIVFQKNRYIDEIIIASNKEYFELIHNIAIQNNIRKLTKLVEGGITRFESVRNAFFQAEQRGSDDIVLIHDAVRPNIDSYFIDSLIIELNNHDGIIPGLKVSDTIKRGTKGFVTETVSRDDLWIVQTPQLFRYKVLHKAYSACGRKNDFTDESSLVEYAGFKVKIAEGRRDNIKITITEDTRILKNAWQKPGQLKFPIRKK
jgi:2-C-methyl-D-erythritol 4-phosphate cytidylyltransferase